MKGETMTEITIYEETARDDLERFISYARIDIDEPRDEESKVSLEVNMEKFVHFVKKGRIIVDEDGKPTVRTNDENYPEIRFSKRPTGSHRRAMDKVKQGHDAGKEMALVASAAGVPTTAFNGIDEQDLKVVWLVYQLFLA